MTDSNLDEKLSETFLYVLKKINVFEKIAELKNLTRVFVFFTTITTASLVVNTIYHNYKINMKYIEIKNKMAELEHIQNTKIESILNTNSVIQYKIEILDNKINCLLDFNENKLHNVNDINPSNDNLKLSLIHPNTITNICANNINNEDDELLSECYDNIPCNNIKKVTGINRLFGW